MYIIIVLIISCIIAYLYISKVKVSAMNFKEIMDKGSLPIITLKERDVPLNFLVDTGSTESHITAEVAKKLLGEPVDIEGKNIITGMGNTYISKKIEAILTDGKKEFKHDFMVNSNLDTSFLFLELDNGIHIDGIIGNDFLKKYKCNIDFESCTIVMA